MKIDIFGLSDTGRLRSNNEDSFLVSPDDCFLLVADGMGGHLAGEVASKLAVEVVAQNLQKYLRGELKTIFGGQPDKRFSDRGNFLVSAIRLANRVIYEKASISPMQKNMGTTIVAAILDTKKNLLSVANVGDSRAYLINKDHIQQLTTDHTLVQEQKEKGLITDEEAASSPIQHILSRAVGVEPTVEVDVKEIYLKPEDAVLLCSDGLSRMLSDAEIFSIFQSDKKASTLARKLISAANERGGLDNITVAILLTS